MQENQGHQTLLWADEAIEEHHPPAPGKPPSRDALRLLEATLEGGRVLQSAQPRLQDVQTRQQLSA